MIVTVTCNPAVDITYRVDSFSAGEVHRVKSVLTRPGGKGVNVARVLHQLGEPVTACGFADAGFVAEIRQLGIREAFVKALPAVRRTVVIDTGTGTTSLWEPGPRAIDGAANLLEERVAGLLQGASAFIVSGSLPRGVRPDLPTRLARLARTSGVPAVLDIDGDSALAAVELAGVVFMPNRDELQRLTGGSDLAAIRGLAERSGSTVLATLGASGMIAVTEQGVWHAKTDPLMGNPTGAGDAAAAAVARGLSRNAPWPTILEDAVALAAAAVHTPVAGEVNLDAYQQCLSSVVVTELETTRR